MFNNVKIVIELLIQLIGVVAWPVTVIIILLVFRRNIESLFLRVKRADLPGGVSIETFPDEIREAIELSQEVKEEKPIQEIKEGRPVIPLTEVNVRMLNLGLSPSPSGLDINYYRQLAEKDPNLALAGLRMEIEIMIKNLGIGWRIAFRERDSASIMARKLHNKRAITSRQSELIQTIVRLCNSAVHGVKVTREQALEILDLALILRDQYVAWLSWGFKDK